MRCDAGTGLFAFAVCRADCGVCCGHALTLLVDDVVVDGEVETLDVDGEAEMVDGVAVVSSRAPCC